MTTDPIEGVGAVSGPKQVVKLPNDNSNAALVSRAKDSSSSQGTTMQVNTVDTSQEIQNTVKDTKKVIDSTSNANANKIDQTQPLLMMMSGITIAQNIPMDQTVVKGAIFDVIKSFRPTNDQVKGKSVFSKDFTEKVPVENITIQDALRNPEISKLMEAQCKSESSETSEHFNFMMALHENLKGLADSDKPESEIISDLKKNIFDVYCKPSSKLSDNIKERLTEVFNADPPDLQEILGALKKSAGEITVELNNDSLLNLKSTILQTEEKLNAHIDSINGVKNKFAELNKIISDPGKFEIPGVPPEMIKEKAIAMREELLPDLKEQFALDAKKALDSALKGVSSGRNQVLELDKIISGRKPLTGTDKEALKAEAAALKTEIINKHISDFPVNNPENADKFVNDFKKGVTVLTGANLNPDMNKIFSALDKLQETCKKTPVDVGARSLALDKVRGEAENFISHNPSSSKIGLVQALLNRIVVAQEMLT